MQSSLSSTSRLVGSAFTCSSPLIKRASSTRAFSNASLGLRARRDSLWAAANRTEVRRYPRRSHSRRSFHASGPASAAKDPYQVLSVAKDASLADIKKSYYSLARKYHPDTNKEKDAQEKFVEIQAAYDTLSDESKRAAYDKYGSASQQPGFDPNAFANAGAGFGGGFNFRDFGAAFRGGPNGASADMFEQLFGGAFGGRAHGRAAHVRGEDLGARIGISFLDSAKGTKRTINITPLVDCSTCSGSGMKAGAKKTQCTTCGGTGQRTFVVDAGFHMATTCDACQGSGMHAPPGSQCRDCNGNGVMRVRKAVSVNIPAGVEDGMTVRVPNEGDAPVSGKGPKGDLLVRINVASSKVFRRQGSNIQYDARIPMHTALLGGRVRVPTLDGDVDVRVPPGTQPGEEMVLKGRGMPPLYGGEKGDLLVTFAIQLPRSLTERQRQLLQAYADDVEGRSAAPKSEEQQSQSETSERPAASRSSLNRSTHDSNGARDGHVDNEDEKEPTRRTATA